MKKLTEDKARRRIDSYFESRRKEKRNSEGELLLSKSGEVLYEEKPYTVTGLALALGFSNREELYSQENEKIKALIDRALLRIEESAEEQLFSKECFHGAKLFLEANFKRWQGKEDEDMSNIGLGVCTLWSE